MTITQEAPARAATPRQTPPHASLIVQGRDRTGIVAAVDSVLSGHDANIVSLDQYSDDPQGGAFFQRTVFSLDNLKAALPAIEHDLTERLADLELEFTLRDLSVPARVAILASRSDHCLLDLLWRQRRGQLPVTVTMVISNHPDTTDEVRAFGIPFFHVPSGDCAEAEHLRLLSGNVDFVVLTRYMRILSGEFIERVGVPIINIHHSFLPAFIGAGPYTRAKERGVKLIYVTEDLDAGPIIEQDVARVTRQPDDRVRPMTTLIDGRKIARDLRSRVAEEVAAFGTIPALATILVGDDPASTVYVANKRRQVREAGMRDVHRALPDSATQEEVAAVVDGLAADASVSGILLQLPLPAGLDSAALIDRIPASKDVDGLTTASAGLLAPGCVPAPPNGVLALLDAEGVPIQGAHAVVVGRSELVGRPMSQLLLHRNATVTTAHRHTTDLMVTTRSADILVVAAGVPGLIAADDVKPGATVIDVGIHRTPAGLVGDVRTGELQGIAARITPVPGGVGPMTIAMLLDNTLRAARWAHRTA